MRRLLVATVWLGCSVQGGPQIEAEPIRPVTRASTFTGEAAGVRRSPVASRVLGDRLRSVGASAILLDWQTGKILATEGDQNTATPGSLLKPFLLSYGLQHHIAEGNTRVYCRRTLRIAGHSLVCTHPADRPLLDAENALALSCNTWFASLARRMTAGDLEEVLRRAHLPHATTRFDDADTRILTALGLENVSATPMQMATAYRTLLLHESHTNAVWNGLRGSVTYGMANNARVDGIEILGKTGTASNPNEWWTHGWFAGAIPNRFVLVVYVPHGDGGTAATLAGTVLQRLLPEKTQ